MRADWISELLIGLRRALKCRQVRLCSDGRVLALGLDAAGRYRAWSDTGWRWSEHECGAGAYFSCYCVRGNPAHPLVLISVF